MPLVYCRLSDFAKAGIAAPPKTWVEFLDDCAKLKAAGITPINIGGGAADTWAANYVLIALIATDARRSAGATCSRRWCGTCGRQRSRDMDGDGLGETANLWESGWDNRVGPQFSTAPLTQWTEVFASGDLPAIAQFVAKHRHPVVAMCEQTHHLAALASIVEAEARAERDIAAEFRAEYDRIVRTISERHWNEGAGIYRDWDVQGRRQVDADMYDAFYFLEFEPDPARAARLVGTLTDPARFVYSVAMSTGLCLALVSVLAGETRR